jgi:dihydroorotate dehydrogenase
MFRPLLRRLRPRMARDVTLRAIETVARLPGGAAIVRTFGDMAPSPLLKRVASGFTVTTPIGLGPGVDPHGAASVALANFGFGFEEIVVSREPIAGTSLETDDRARTIVAGEPFENDGLEATIARLQAPGSRAIARGFRLVRRNGSAGALAADDERVMRDRLRPFAAFFVVDEGADGNVAPLDVSDTLPTFIALDSHRSGDELAIAARRAVAGGGAGVRIEVADEATSRIAAVRAAIGIDATLLVATTSNAPADALVAIDAGATLVEFGSGFVFAGPLLAKRTNDALAARIEPTIDPRPAYAQPWFWTLALGTGLCVGGLLAWIVAATRIVLPYDETFLGWSRLTLALREPRLLRFMTHDRITLAGSMLSIGILYAGVALGDLRRGARWAKNMVVASSFFGLATYWLWLGYGYWDPLHALLTVIVAPFIILTSVLRLGVERPPTSIDPYESRERKRALVGQLLFVIIGAGFIVGGLTISFIGITGVFVPTDLVYLQCTAAALHAANPHLVPLVAHDRAGFGGDLAADGIAIFLTGLWGFRGGNRGLWWTIALAGIPGFGAALGVHISIGYLDPLHLAPPITALALYVCGLVLTYPYLTRRRT